MQNTFRYSINNPNFGGLGYLTAIANTQDKHDPSAPSHYHWKILKCRMIIFSNSSVLACPDKNDAQQVHIVFNKMTDDYDKLVSLFLKFSLVHDGSITSPTPEVFQMCFSYTMSAKLAPQWNTLGTDYLINNRDFLTSKGPQDGIKYNVWSNDHETVIDVKPVKIHFVVPDGKFQPGEWVRVLPSLNKATIEEYYESLPKSANFKCYKDLRRHWKNIHGYRIPEEECGYLTVRFWRGEPLIYPQLCVVRNHPIVTPVPKPTETKVLSNFMNCMKSRMPRLLGQPMLMHCNDEIRHQTHTQVYKHNVPGSQAVSLCTPTQHSKC